MLVTSVVMSIALAVLFLALGAAKIAGVPAMATRFEHLGYDARMRTIVGALEVAAAVGLVIGVFWPPLGVAAAIGLVALLVGAVVSHRRAGDEVKEIVPAVWVGLVAAATAVLVVVAT
ncbi:DoxX-like protein [Herbihabitans rhizosphaerae]|uniref:DoxX-like protein n=1 Tax=Herbihabitans rhizosphaerae TaxID=1872711 RepID=A0A4Q7L715_9PSEU|nr:DoxX family protein [Herbihabitans rhizosphaerae]RZS45124.1 DoxX-like protein [Herbihabitans rhizosphaerae]